MVRIFIVLIASFVFLLPLASVDQKTDVEELRKEHRLPEWANYSCYQDARNIQSGWFMLVAYEPANVPNLKDDNAFGYERGLTYQEYIASDKDIVAINMPASPEAYASGMKAGTQGGHVSAGVIELVEEHIRSIKNAIAIAKATAKSAKEWPTIEKELLADEEEQALLDAPEGTNYHNFTAKHPEFPDAFLDRQKYYNSGIEEDRKNFRIYREGNVIFEKEFGSEVFETEVTREKATDAELPTVRIAFQDTSSGLRFVKTHSLDNSSVGIPTVGKCDPILKR